MIRAIAQLVFINLRRHKFRSLLSVAGIGIGAAAMLAIVSIVLGAVGMFQNILAADSQYVIFEKDVSDLFFSSVPMEDVEALQREPLIAHADPLLVGIVSSSEHPIVTCFGVDASDSRLREAHWIAGDPARFGKEGNAIYLGSRAAEFLKKALGEVVPIGNHEFNVAGVLQTANGFEDGGVFMPLNEAQEFFHREGLASIITVKLRQSSEGEALKRIVALRFPKLMALENRQFNQSYSQFRILNFTSWAVGICAFLLGGMSVANTMLMSVFGRIREIAILRVCGFSKGQVFVVILGEALLIAISGVIAGLLLGCVALRAMNSAPQFQGYVQASVHAQIVIGIFGIAILTACLGSLYPAWFAATVQPAEALRFE